MSLLKELERKNRINPKHLKIVNLRAKISEVENRCKDVKNLRTIFMIGKFSKK